MLKTLASSSLFAVGSLGNKEPPNLPIQPLSHIFFGDFFLATSATSCSAPLITNLD